MNKTDLINEVAKETGLSKAQAAGAVASLVKSIKDAVKAGKTIKLIGFGAFSCGKRKARKGVNPHTKEKIRIPARRYPKFRPGKEFKRHVN